MTILNILYLVNSKLGVAGNIGFRIEKVMQRAESEGHQVVSFSRRRSASLDKTKNLDMGWCSELPRILNGVRIYLWPSLRSRYWDYHLFEWLEKKNESRLLSLVGAQPVVHMAEINPHIMRLWQQRGAKVILDMPIAPQAYVERLGLEHGAIEGLTCDNFLRDREFEAFQQADLILAPSPFVAEEIKKLGISLEKIKVVPFGVDVERTQRSAAKDLHQGIDFCFAGVGNFRKGLQVLLEAWRDDAFANDRLHLCGRMTPAVLNLLRENNFSNVICPGFVSTKEYFSKCDVFVFPSLMEGSAKAVYEAMASGLPVITTHSSGSVVQEGLSGFIVPILDVKALKERMMFFKKQPQTVLTMGKLARSQVQHMTWVDYGSRVMACYHDLEKRRLT